MWWALTSAIDPVRLAFIGDTGADDNAHRVLNLTSQWQSDAVIHVGDFDYNDDPNEFAKMINDFLPTTPFIAAMGNHDVMKWDEYKALLQPLHSFDCVGSYGEDYNCNIKGIQVYFGGFGLSNVTFNASSFLSANTAPWKICTWHMNQHDFQTGHKHDDVGFVPYDLCRSAGAMIVNGREHVYARTTAMSSLSLIHI